MFEMVGNRLVLPRTREGNAETTSEPVEEKDQRVIVKIELRKSVGV